MSARATATLVLLLAACTPVDDQIAGDARDLAGDVRARAGHDPAAWQGDPAADDDTALAQVRTLLAGPLTEDAAIKIALLNNRAVQASYERLGVARADLVQAGRLSNPIFDANAKFFSSGTEIELALLQPVLDLFFRPLRERLAEHEFAATKAALTRELVHLVFEVRRAFVGVRAAQRLVAVQQQVRDLATGAHELMAKLHAAGNVTDPELTAAHAAVLRARLDLAAAEQVEQEAREPLNVLLGVWGEDVSWRVGDALSDEPGAALHVDHVEARSVAASLDLAENRARIDAAAQRAGITAWDGWFPQAAVGVAAKKEVDGGWGAGPSLAFDLPLFDAGGARVAGAQALLRQAMHQHVQVAVATRSAARLLRERCLAACERVTFLAQALLPAQARLVRETVQRYNAMQIGAFDVLTARRQEVEAAREHLDAVRAAWLARLDLEELLAGSSNHAALAPRWPQPWSNAGAPAEGH